MAKTPQSPLNKAKEAAEQAKNAIGSAVGAGCASLESALPPGFKEGALGLKQKAMKEVRRYRVRVEDG